MDKNSIAKNAVTLGDRESDEQHVSQSIKITFPDTRVEFPVQSKTTLIRSPRIDSSSETQDYAHSLYSCKLKIIPAVDDAEKNSARRATGYKFVSNCSWSKTRALCGDSISDRIDS
jgi:hypothetical protein